MRNLTVRARLTLWNVLTVAVLIVLLGLGVSWRIRSDILAGVDRELRMRSDQFLQFGFPGPPGDPVPLDPKGAPMDPGPDAPAQPLDPNATGMRGPQQPSDPPNSPAPQALGAPMPMAGGPRNRARGPGDGLAPPMGAGIGRRQGMNPLRPRLFDEMGRSMTNVPGENPWNREALDRALQGEESFTTVALEGEEFRVYTRPLPPDRQGRVLQLARPLSDTRRALQGVNETLIAYAPLAILVAAAAGYLATRRALQPVADLAQSAERITAENLSGRIDARGDDEFAQLGGTFNAMLDRLERAFRDLEASVETQRRFVADASHELRTPLAAIKANTSLALSTERAAKDYRESLESVDKSASRMNALVQDLLTLARADAGRLVVEKDSADLREVLEGVVEGFRGKGAAIELREVGQTATVLGSDLSLTRLFENLLSNAVRHTPKDGKIEVTVESTPQEATVTVSDTGEGIAPEHLDKLGERFYRVDASRARSEGGVGLGLAICRSIVDAHGGKIEFESEVGKGTKVQVSFPR